MLEQSFNTMASQIEKLVADNKILARSLSHDIRTPMACLRFGVEAALDTKSLEKTIEIGKEEVNKHDIYIKFMCKKDNKLLI